MKTLKLVLLSFVILAPLAASAIDFSDKQFDEDLKQAEAHSMCAVEVANTMALVTVKCDNNIDIAWSIYRGVGSAAVTTVGAQMMNLKVKFVPQGCNTKGDTTTCYFANLGTRSAGLTAATTSTGK